MLKFSFQCLLQGWMSTDTNITENFGFTVEHLSFSIYDNSKFSVLASVTSQSSQNIFPNPFDFQSIYSKVGYYYNNSVFKYYFVFCPCRFYYSFFVLSVQFLLLIIFLYQLLGVWICVDTILNALISDIVFVRWMFLSFVSVALSGSQENVVTVCCLVRNTFEILPGMIIEDPGQNVFLGIES